MIQSDLKDKDGFPLKFDENSKEDEKEFFLKTFPTVDMVAKKRVHCTVCDTHIGTAPLAERVVRSHPILNVTHCSKCFAFYNSGEFGKGEDGSEYYCRWCGQGGEVYCCSNCPFVFCSKCIKLNLSQSCVDDIENNEDWSCFVCDPKVIWHLRAQQWALLNYIEKQTQKIKDMNLTTEGEANYLLSRDSSGCCVRKRMSDPKKTMQMVNKRKSSPSNGFPGPAAKKPAQRQLNGEMMMGQKRNNDEIVCTPDILSMFEQDEAGGSGGAHPAHMQPQVPKTTTIRPVRVAPSTIPPPLAIRQTGGAPRVRFPQQPLAPRVGAPTNPPLPVYHTIGGFRIDLNHAARQEIFRLPNGKLIQVRKQITNAPNAQGTIPTQMGGVVGMAQRNMAPNIRPNSIRNIRPMGNNRMARPPVPVQPQIQQSRFLISDATPAQIAAATGGSVMPTITPIATPSINQTAAPNAQTSTTIFQQQAGSILVNRATHPDNEFGKARTSFEDKIISGMEICQHTINKMITLSNSTSFKTSRNFQDLKELYIHLKYLYSFTIGKFTSLQEKLTEDMEKLAENDPALNDKEDDDDLEIVDKHIEVITVDSDDEEAAKNAAKKKTPRKQTLEPLENTGNSAESIEVMPDLPMLPDIDDSEETIDPSLLIPEIVESDPKLEQPAVIKIEKIDKLKTFNFLQEPLEKLKQGEEIESFLLPDIGDEDCSIIEPPRAPTPEKAESEDEGVEIEDTEDLMVVEVGDDDETDKNATEKIDATETATQEKVDSAEVSVSEDKESAEKDKENEEVSSEKKDSETQDEAAASEDSEKEIPEINLESTEVVNDSSEDKTEPDETEEKKSEETFEESAQIIEDSMDGIELMETSQIDNQDESNDKPSENPGESSENPEEPIEIPEKSTEILEESNDGAEDDENSKDPIDNLEELCENQEKSIEDLNENPEDSNEDPLEDLEKSMQNLHDLPESSPNFDSEVQGNGNYPEQNGNDLLGNGITDIDPEELLNSIGNEQMDDDDLPDLPDFDKEADNLIPDAEAIQKQVAEIMESSPMDTN